MTAHKNRLQFYRQRRARDDMERVSRKQLPLAAFYGRHDEFEGARHLFYDRCAKVFGWKGWDSMSVDLDYDDLVIARSAGIDQPLPQSGFGGRNREIAAIERNRLIAINLSSSPFEWLASHGRLETRNDAPGIGNIRFSAGIKFRDLLVGAEPAGMKSANLEGRSGGGVPMLINDFKVDCMHAINGIKADMIRHQPKRWGKLKTGGRRKTWIAEKYSAERPTLFMVLERLIYAENWIFEGIPKGKQKAVMDQIHNGLDQVALFFGMITPREYDARWKRQAEKKVAGPQQPSSSHR